MRCRIVRGDVARRRRGLCVLGRALLALFVRRELRTGEKNERDVAAQYKRTLASQLPRGVVFWLGGRALRTSPQS